MAMGKPILALVAADSETASVVSSARCGIVVPPSDVSGIADAISLLKGDDNLCEQYGLAGREFLMKHMEQSVVVRQYEEVIQTLSEKRM